MRYLTQRRAAWPAGALALAVLVAGCGNSETVDNQVPGKILNVYVSAPLEGPHAGDGQAIVNGAKLALAHAGGRAGKYEVHANFLDDTAGRPAHWDPATVGDNARRAGQDTGAIAFIGDFDSGATRISLPITNQARILQVTPGATAVDLTKSGAGVGSGEPDRFYPSGTRTFGRVLPADDVQARAAADWAKALGIKAVSVQSDETPFGRGLAADFTSEAERLGIRVGNVVPTGTTGAVYLAGTFRRHPSTFHFTGTRVFASDAALVPGFLSKGGTVYATSPAVPAAHLGSAARKFIREYRKQFGSPPNPYAAYGYEAMAVVLDSIDRADNGRDRTKVTKAFLATRDRHSILGTYSIDPEAGDTSLGSIAGYRVENGKPIFDRVIRTR